MNKKEIMKKYLEGETSLQEEKELFDSIDANENPWAQYIVGNKQHPPTDLEDKIWETIQAEKKQKQRFFYGIAAAAASIVLVLGFVFYTGDHETEMTLNQKEQMLQEALSMFPEEENNKEILYSDELIEIYVATN